MSWADDFTWVEKVSKVGPTNLNKINKAIRELKGLTFNVKDYGAVGDCTILGVGTDDTAACQAAIAAAAAAGGGTVIFPPSSGGYKITAPLVVGSSPVNLVGLGPQGPLTAPMLVNVGASSIVSIDHHASGPVQVLIEGLTFRGSNQITPAGVGVLLNSGIQVTLRRVGFAYCAIGLSFRNNNDGGPFNFCERNIIEQVVFSTCTTSIKFYAEAGSTASMDYNTFIDVGMNVEAGCVGVDFGSDSPLQMGLANSQFINFQAWLNGTGAVGWRIGKMDMGGTTFIAGFEGGAGTTGIDILSTAVGLNLMHVHARMAIGGTVVSAAAGQEFYYDIGSQTWSAGGTGASTNWRSYQIAGDAQPRLRLRSASGGVIDFGDGTNAPDASLYHSSAGIIATDTQFRAGTYLWAGNGGTGQVILGDVSPFVGGAARAGILFGLAANEEISRAGVAQLKSPGNFQAADGIATKTKAGTPTDADFTTTPPVGTIVVDTSANKIWVRTGTNVWKAVAVA